MIIFGLGHRAKTVAEGEFFCPHDHSRQAYKRKKAARYFSLFFIPLIPIQQLGEYVECQHCMHKYEVDVLNYTPPTPEEKLVVEMRADLDAGMPVHMVQQKLANRSYPVETASAVMEKAVGLSQRTCRQCGFIYRRTVTQCTNCGTRL